MTGIQKIIKYFALSLAAVIIISIITSVMFGITSISNAFLDDEEDTSKKDIYDLNVPTENIYMLDIELEASNLLIKEGTELKAETNNDDIKIIQNGNKLEIKEKDNSIFSNGSKEDLIIYVPSDFSFNEVEIEMGVGKISIDSLTTRKLDMDFGAGKSVINNLNVLDRASLNGGAGTILINGETINNLDLEVGVGSFELNSILTGINNIEAGVGKLDINILDSFTNYRVSAEKGLGSCKLNGETMNDMVVYGTGNNVINIAGGIGSINIDFNN